MLPPLPPFPFNSSTTTEPNLIDASVTFNVVAIQFSDPECTDPTGVEEIAADEDFANCYTLIDGGPHYLSECRSEGVLVTQQFSANDDTCTGEVNMTLSRNESLVVCVLVLMLNGWWYMLEKFEQIGSSWFPLYIEQCFDIYMVAGSGWQFDGGSTVVGLPNRVYKFCLPLDDASLSPFLRRDTASSRRVLAYAGWSRHSIARKGCYASTFVLLWRRYVNLKSETTRTPSS